MHGKIKKDKIVAHSFFLQIILISLALIVGCSSSGNLSKKWEEPVDDQAIIIGNVLVENINQEFGFENWGWAIHLVFLRKGENGIIQKIETTTDDNGYFIVPNVPQGSYVLKEVLLPVSGSKPVKIINDWEVQDSKYYEMRHPEEPTDYAAGWFPPESKHKIMDFNIMWFGLRTAHIENLSEKSVGEVLFTQKREALESFRFYPNGTPYSRLDPLTYFKNKFPDSDWWN